MIRRGRRLLSRRRRRRISSRAGRRTVAPPFPKPIATVLVALGVTLLVVFIAANAGPRRRKSPDARVSWIEPSPRAPAPPKPPSVAPVEPPPVEPAPLWPVEPVAPPPPVEPVGPPPAASVELPPVEPVEPPSQPRGLSAADVARLIKYLDSKERARRQAAFEKLCSLGAQEKCAAHLLEKRKAILALLSRKGLGKAIRLLEYCARDLHKKRRAALAFISDGRKFTKQGGRGEVSRLVARVRSAYDVRHRIPRLSRGTARWVDRLFEYDAYLARLGRSLETDYARYRKILLLLKRAPLFVRNFPVSGGEFDLHAYNAKVMRINERVEFHVSRGERQGIRLTNRYRILLGLRALLINASLVGAARQHSREMKRLGYFSHSSPKAKYRTPWARAEVFGYPKGGCMGEGIALCGPSAAAAHACWLGSPPHHRNKLNPNYFDVGMGHSAGRWTEMFGGSTETAKKHGLRP